MPAGTLSDGRIMSWYPKVSPANKIPGAEWGANDRRHGATPGHVRPFTLVRHGTSGHARHHPATLRKCLLSSRSRVRVAVGTQTAQLDCQSTEGRSGSLAA